MKKISSLACVLLLIFNSACLFGEGVDPKARPTPPPGPLIQKHAPSFSEWVVTTSFGVPEKSASPAVESKDDKKNPDAKVVIIKTGNVIRTIVCDPDGKIWNVWNQNALRVVVAPNGKDIGHIKAPEVWESNRFYLDYSNSDFSGFDWISPQNFEGLIDYQGKKCLFFRVKNSSGDSLAYTDLETRLPMAHFDGTSLTTYQYEAPPSAMQQLPENVQQFLNAEKSHEQSLVNRKSALF
jgi:hypothetical protein